MLLMSERLCLDLRFRVRGESFADVGAGYEVLLIYRGEPRLEVSILVAGDGENWTLSIRFSSGGLGRGKSCLRVSGIADNEASEEFVCLYNRLSFS